jgi:hypothetical protein
MLVEIYKGDEILCVGKFIFCEYSRKFCTSKRKHLTLPVSVIGCIFYKHKVCCILQKNSILLSTNSSNYWIPLSWLHNQLDYTSFQPHYFQPCLLEATEDGIMFYCFRAAMPI